MKPLSINVFNQEVEQYKLLSSSYGVGAVIPTKLGVLIMPLSVDEWDFIQRAKNTADLDEQHVKDAAVNLVENPAFLRYLQNQEGMTGLKYLVGIPHMQLNEYNRQEVKRHPMYRVYKQYAPNGREDLAFSVPAIMFPRWMYSSRNGILKEYREWIIDWRRTHNNSTLDFVPPMDANGRLSWTKNGNTYEDYPPLKQMQLVLVCPNGHISDIPWDRFFSADHDPSVKNDLYKEGFDLFAYTPALCSCGGQHKLEFSENMGHTSGFGYLRCTKCNEKTSLEGILNLKPKCSRETPWRGVDNNGHFLMDSSCKEGNKDRVMRVMLTTSPSLYYADVCSSIFVPDRLNGNELKGLKFLNETAYANYIKLKPTASKQDFWREIGGDNAIRMAIGLNGIHVSDNEFATIKACFVGEGDSQSNTDKNEEMRFNEYDYLANAPDLNTEHLQTHAIDIPDSLSEFFSRISQVPLLTVTKTQLNFFRVQSPTPERNSSGGIDYPEGQKLSGLPINQIKIYPVIQDLGEGLFFQFRQKKLEEWGDLINLNKDSVIQNRYLEKAEDDKNTSLAVMLERYGQRHVFYLLHTFAHSLIKELEFSCGYPSASLSERIYFSNRMAGVLIYTAQGSEGSMGGLVWQGKKEIIGRIISGAIERARQCSSDPICWEHEKETMNMAACFSCQMISETSCEFRNMGLDRQALVNEQFGFFKDLL